MNKAIIEALVNERQLTLLFTTEADACKLAFYIRQFISEVIRSVTITKQR
jgi:hypothetical protein